MKILSISKLLIFFSINLLLFSKILIGLPTNFKNETDLDVKMIIRQEHEFDFKETKIIMPFTIAHPEESIFYNKQSLFFEINGIKYKCKCSQHPNSVLVKKEDQDIIIEINGEEFLRINKQKDEIKKEQKRTNNLRRNSVNLLLYPLSLYFIYTILPSIQRYFR